MQFNLYLENQEKFKKILSKEMEQASETLILKKLQFLEIELNH